MSTTSNVYNSSTPQQKDQQPTGYVQSAYNAAANLATAATNTLSSALSNNTPPTETAAQLGGTTDPRVQNAYEGNNNLVTTRSDKIAEAADNTASQTSGTTQSYTSQAYDGAANLAQAASNTLSSTLQGVAPTAATTTTTTTSPQYRNQQPHVGGVGDLGTDSQSNVAMLPEERANPEPFEGRGSADISTTNPALKDPVNIQSRLNAREPPVPYPEGGSTHVGQVESRGGQHASTGGVGDLGTRSDADVARLPEERANPDPLAAAPGTAPHHTQESTTITGRQAFGAQNFGADAYNRQSQPDTLADSGDVQMGPAKGSAGWKADQNQDRAPHSGSTDQQHATQDLGPDSYSRETHQDTYADDKAAEHPQEHGEKDGPTKMDKVKGNLLIAKGKLTKGQDKVEQGKKLKETGETY